MKGFGSALVGSRYLWMAVSSSVTLEDTASDAFRRNAPEEALDLVKPRRRCWGEVHMKTWMPLEPRLDFRVLVRGVIVGDQGAHQVAEACCDRSSRKNLSHSCAMSLHALADDAAGGDIESSKQCRVPLRL